MRRNTEQDILDRLMPIPMCGCWIWDGTRFSRNGYGRVNWQGRERQAHIVVYEILVGPVPRGLLLDHKCRVRPCCNPDHLEPVTSLVNTLRGDAVLITPYLLTAPKVMLEDLEEASRRLKDALLVGGPLSPTQKG